MLYEELTGQIIEAAMKVHGTLGAGLFKLAGLQVGLLLNFNVPHLKDGMLRVANTIAPHSASTAYSAL